MGLLAGWAAAGHGALVYWGGEILMETLFIFWILWCLDFLLAARQSRRDLDWVLAGLFGGLAAVTRFLVVNSLQVEEMTSSVQLVQALGGGWDRTQLPTPNQVGVKTTNADYKLQQ